MKEVNMNPKVHKMKKKVEKNYPEFVDAISGLSLGELKEKLLRYTFESEKVQRAKEADEKLQEAAELKSELEAPYKSALDAIKLKSRYIMELIGEE